MKMKTILAAAAVVFVAAGCVKEQGGLDVPVGGGVEIVKDAPMVIAEMSEPATRTCIDAAYDATGTLPVLWEAADEVGVFFTEGSSNVRYANISGKVPNAAFGATAQVSGSEIAYVYYPYDAANDGKAATSLSGTVPAEQAMDGSIHGDYKYGKLKAKVDGGYKFEFHNIVSLVRFNIDASGTALSGDKLETVTLTVTRGDAAVPVVGDITFSAVDDQYTLGDNTSNTLNTVWNKDASGVFSGFASVLPEVKSGDKLTFVIKTANYESSLTVTSKVDFKPGVYYNFPLTLAGFGSKLSVKKKVSGNFTAATLNVDGLPNIAYKVFGITIKELNPEGPLASGTTTISKKIADSNWDIVGFSEDFAFHNELTSYASANYTFQEYDNAAFPTEYYSGITGDHWATDGLSFATNNSTCKTFKLISKNVYPSEAVSGGIFSGANESIDKSFRHYLVTMIDGTELDVIITHMNTYSSSGSGHIDAQHAQLSLIAAYINQISAANKRPIIFMGDTNCRYTRHDFQTYFWSKLNANVKTTDAWVQHHRDGIYPTYGTLSLMTRAHFAGDTKNDIVCSDDQRGEVVDKIIYFNVEGASVTINATDCYNDVANFTKSTENVSYSGVQTEDENGKIATNQTVSYTKNIGLADHFPVVAKFSYSGTVPMN